MADISDKVKEPKKEEKKDISDKVTSPDSTIFEKMFEWSFDKTKKIGTYGLYAGGIAALFGVNPFITAGSFAAGDLVTKVKNKEKVQPIKTVKDNTYSGLGVGAYLQYFFDNLIKLPMAGVKDFALNSASIMGFGIFGFVVLHNYLNHFLKYKPTQVLDKTANSGIYSTFVKEPYKESLKPNVMKQNNGFYTKPVPLLLPAMSFTNVLAPLATSVKMTLSGIIGFLYKLSNSGKPKEKKAKEMPYQMPQTAYQPA